MQGSAAKLLLPEMAVVILGLVLPFFPKKNEVFSGAGRALRRRCRTSPLQIQYDLTSLFRCKPGFNSAPWKPMDAFTRDASWIGELVFLHIQILLWVAEGLHLALLLQELFRF